MKRALSAAAVVLLLGALGIFRFINRPPASNTTASSTDRGHELRPTQNSNSSPHEQIPAPTNDADLSSHASETPTSASELAESECWRKIHLKADDDRGFKTILARDLGNAVPIWYINGESPDLNPDNNPSSLFLTGLAQVGYLQGVDGGSHPQEALDFLERAHQLDPSNSAPLIFAALVARELGDESKFAQYLLKAANSQRFDSYVLEIVKAGYRSANNPQDLIHAVNFAAQVPIPDLVAVKKILRERPSESISMQLMRDGLNKDKSTEFDDWMGIEYAVGRETLSEETKNEYPTYAKLVAAKTNGTRNLTQRMWTELENNCDPESLWPFVYELKRIRRAPSPTPSEP